MIIPMFNKGHFWNGANQKAWLGNCILGVTLVLGLFTAVSEADNRTRMNWCLSALEQLQRQFDDGSVEGDVRLRRAIRSTLPAYRSDVDSLYFSFAHPGITLGLEIPPFGQTAEQPRFFRLEYDPSRFLPWNVIRRTFGNSRVTLTSDDISHIEMGYSYMFGLVPHDSGEIVFIHLKDRSQTSPNRDRHNGPILMISRDTGRVIFLPANHGGVSGAIEGLVSEVQNFGAPRGWRNTGAWYTSDDGVQISSPPSTNSPVRPIVRIGVSGLPLLLQ